MTARTYLSCDGPKCTETTPDWLADERGWTREHGDLCKRCSTGKCAGTVGRRPEWMGVDQWDPCACVLPAGHDGDCACRHDLGEE